MEVEKVGGGGWGVVGGQQLSNWKVKMISKINFLSSTQIKYSWGRVYVCEGYKLFGEEKMPGEWWCWRLSHRPSSSCYWSKGEEKLFKSAIHWDMQERDKRSFRLFRFIFDSSLTFANDSDLVVRLLRNFLRWRLEKLSMEGAWMAIRFRSLSVCEVRIDCAKTSLMRSGWLLASDTDVLLCFKQVSCLHARACGYELGRTANVLNLWTEYIPPERSSRNSSSSEELMRSSASDDWRESDWKGFH